MQDVLIICHRRSLNSVVASLSTYLEEYLKEVGKRAYIGCYGATWKVYDGYIRVTWMEIAPPSFFEHLKRRSDVLDFAPIDYFVHQPEDITTDPDNPDTSSTKEH